jgi:hypothetical protein
MLALSANTYGLAGIKKPAVAGFFMGHRKIMNSPDNCL